MTMKAVFLDCETFSDNISFTAIEQQVTKLTCFAFTKPDNVIERCKDSDIVITNKVVFNAEIIERLSQVKLICIAATGYNNIDIEAAEKNNICVTNVSGYAGKSVSQYVLAQILEYYQQTSHHNANTKHGLWQQCNTFCYHGNAITELAGKTIAIVGYGSLGRAVAKLADAFEMKVLISERPNTSKIRKGRVRFEQAVNQADILSLHCPLTNETTNLINSVVLNKMKPTAMLINTARGLLVNSEDLLIALKDKKIAFAVLDVLEEEPPRIDHPLLSAIQNNIIKNLKVTAHIAWASSESQQRLISLLSDNIAAFKKGKRLNRLDEIKL